MGQVYIYEINDILGRLSDYELKTEINYRGQISRKQKSLCSEFIVKKLVSNLKKINVESIHYAHDIYGKPFIKELPNVFFSISYTANIIAIAIGNTPVGIDIECKKTVKVQIAQRFFTQKECDFLAEKKTNINEWLLIIWTQKEAYAKYRGTGLTPPLKNLNVIDNDVQRHLTTYIGKKNILSLYQQDIEEDFEWIPRLGQFLPNQ